MERRNFAKMIGLGALAMQTGPAFASSEILKSPKAKISRVPLGLCNHSLRSMQLNAQQLIEYAIEQRLDSVLLNTLQPFESMDEVHLSKLSKIAKTNNVSIYIGAGSISKT